MAEIKPINNFTTKKSVINAKTTGIAVATSVLLTTISPKVKPLKKIHKPLGYITAALTLFHIFECNKYKFHNKNNTKININA